MNQSHVLVQILDTDERVFGLGTPSNSAEERPSLIRVGSTSKGMFPHAFLHVEHLGTVRTREGLINLGLAHPMSHLEVLPHPLP